MKSFCGKSRKDEKIAKKYKLKYPFKKVDVVITVAFDAICSSGLFLNLVHADPAIKMSKIWLNYLHVIEDIGSGKDVLLKAEDSVTDCYPSKNLKL